MQPVDPRIAAQRPTGCCSARLLGCWTRSPLYLIGDAASRRGLSRVGYFITLNGPLNVNPPSFYYIKLQCPYVCVCLCTPFRHDCRTATKFDTHIWGLIWELFESKQGVPGGILGGQTFKRPGNVINCPEKQYIFLTSTPLWDPRGGEF